MGLCSRSLRPYLIFLAVGIVVTFANFTVYVGMMRTRSNTPRNKHNSGSTLQRQISSSRNAHPREVDVLEALKDSLPPELSEFKDSVFASPRNSDVKRAVDSVLPTVAGDTTLRPDSNTSSPVESHHQHHNRHQHRDKVEHQHREKVAQGKREEKQTVREVETRRPESHDGRKEHGHHHKHLDDEVRHHPNEAIGLEEEQRRELARLSPKHHKAGGGRSPSSSPPPAVQVPLETHHISSSKALSKKERQKMRKMFAVESNPSEFAPKSYDEYVAFYDTCMKVNVTDLEQSSQHFNDIIEHSHSGVKLPTETSNDLLKRFGVVAKSHKSGEDSPEGAIPHSSSYSSAVGDELEYCDPQNGDFTPETDRACEKYLSNIHNWLSIKPMSSILSTGRTIKFKLHFRHSNVRAVLKVSQKKFVLEPASEVIAYGVDRMLGFQRVPPVVWVPFPVDFLRAACATMDPFYVHWFDAFTIKYSPKSLFSNCYESSVEGEAEKTPVRCVNVSIQLWLVDVHNADETIIAPTGGYKHYLDLPTPPDKLKKLQLIDSHPPPIDATAAAEGLLVPRLNYKRLAMKELINNFVFDAIIGNTDRWFGHNSFALGGCIESRPGEFGEKASCTEPEDPSQRTISSTRLIFIDQGSSFYRSGFPEENPFKSPENLCRFPKRTAEMLVQHATAPFDASGTTFYLSLKKRLPTGLFNLASTSLVRGAGTRLWTLGKHVESCVQNFTRADVFYFED